MADTQAWCSSQPGYRHLSSLLLLSLLIIWGTGVQGQNNTTSAAIPSTQTTTAGSFTEATTLLDVTAFLRALTGTPLTNIDAFNSSLDLHAALAAKGVPTYVDAINFFAESDTGVVVLAPSNDAMAFWDADQHSLEYHILTQGNLSNLGPASSVAGSPMLFLRNNMQQQLATNPGLSQYLNVNGRFISLQHKITGNKTFHGTADSFGTSGPFECVFFTSGVSKNTFVCKIDSILKQPSLLAEGPADIQHRLPSVYNYLKYYRQDMTYLCGIIEQNTHRPMSYSSAVVGLSPDLLLYYGLNMTLQQVLQKGWFGTFFAPTDDAWRSYLQAHNLDSTTYTTSAEAANLVLSLYAWRTATTLDLQAVYPDVPGINARFVGVKRISASTADLAWGWYQPMMTDIDGTPPSQIARVLEGDIAVGKAYVQVIDTVLDSYTVTP